MSYLRVVAGEPRIRATVPAMNRRPGCIVIYRDKAGEYRWRVVAPNGRIVADSAEGYVRRRKAVSGLARCRLVMLNWDPKRPDDPARHARHQSCTRT